ncbi:hypothetical protein [Rhodoplanes serenus]|uniref:hypothetical protein n=1 Tax=Rhodoplanes serenus TaxID=200615 RepID=UPI000DACF455|nr:hypothetical protein [Rhodoplanes serenus]RAI34777.1 hypothetical protein CH340_08015 [Rhodoplanes serenus]
MLPTFRTMVIAVAAVFLALMVTARGLVTAPEAVTRIGEVPPLGRTLVQLAQVPLDDTQKRFVAEAVARAERAEIEAEARIQQADAAGRSVTADGAAAPRAPETASEMASEIAADSRPAGGPSLPLVAADERRRPAAAVPASADPLGDLIRAVVPETPEPSPRPAGSGDEGGGTVVALAAAPAAPPAPSPAMPPEPVAAGAAPADPVSADRTPADRTPADPVPADPERGAAAAAPGEAVVAALPTAEPAVVFGPERPAAKPTAQKAKRTAKPAARKKARASRPARRPVVRTVSRPVAPAPAATTYQTYTPFFGSPAPTAQPAAQPGTLRR